MQKLKIYHTQFNTLYKVWLDGKRLSYKDVYNLTLEAAVWTRQESYNALLSWARNEGIEPELLEVDLT